MTWGIPTDIFLDIHVTLSLIGLVFGLIVLYGLLSGEVLGAWTALFLAAMILTSVTGFPLPPFGLDPPRMVGILSLVLLAIAVLAIYAFRLRGAWRSRLRSAARGSRILAGRSINRPPSFGGGSPTTPTRARYSLKAPISRLPVVSPLSSLRSRCRSGARER